MEEGLRHADPGGVVCELEGRLDLVALRRLQLAAEPSDVRRRRLACQIDRHRRISTLARRNGQRDRPTEPVD